MLVTVSSYRTITLDTTSPDDAVTAALVDAQTLLEEDLGGRPLESAERTERMYPDSNGRLYPIVTPVTEPPDGYRLDGATIYGSWPFLGLADLLNPLGYVDLTYTGGYVERTANPTASNRLPRHVEEDLAWTAFWALNPSPVATAIPPGATSAGLGDASIGFGSGNPPQGADAHTTWSQATMRLRRRRI